MRYVIVLVVVTAASCMRLGLDPTPLGVDAPDGTPRTESDADAGADADADTDGDPDADEGDGGSADGDPGPGPDADAAPPPPLEITSTPVTIVGIASTYSYDADANAPDPLAWSLLSGPSAMAVEATTGVVTWTPSSRGAFPVSIEVSNGREVARQDYTVSVGGGSMNGLRPEELLESALGRSPTALEALVARPLREGGLAPPVTAAIEEDPGSAALMRTVVSCALEPGETLRVSGAGAELLLRGELGLAPEWREGSCGTACQEWVSACLYARVNSLAETVPIVLVGPHPSLPVGGTSGPREAVFFGSYFSAARRAYACSEGPARSPGRRCSAPGARCSWISALGSCGAACRSDATGRALECGPRGGRAFAHPITVFPPSR